jgi:hypothetical protein
MKRIFVLSAVIILIFNLSIFAQSPEKFNYQAAIHDASGNVINEKEIALKISILQGALFR